jgi:hypothetical protein
MATFLVTLLFCIENTRVSNDGCIELHRMYGFFACPVSQHGDSRRENISFILTSNSNIEILERFQSKVLRLIVDAPWYVSSSVIRNDFQVPSVKEEIGRFSSHYNVRISVHPTELIASLTEPPIQRCLRRYCPHDLLVRF